MGYETATSTLMERVPVQEESCPSAREESSLARVNLGCGSDHRPGYLNIDAFTPEADLRSDLCHLGLKSGSVSEIHCSHVLEHLAEPLVVSALAEMRRVLDPEAGRVVVLVPDFTWCLERWLSLPESQKWGWAIDTIFGNQNHEGEHHRTGFTQARLRSMLEETGFGSIETDTVYSHGMQSIRATAGVSDRPKMRIKLPRRAVNKVVMARYALKGLTAA